MPGPRRAGRGHHRHRRRPGHRHRRTRPPFPAGAGRALLGGFFTYSTTSAALALRYGDTPTAVLRWYVPCLLTVITRASRP
ncbi:hypothetical protein [Streptomyces sp. NPDC088789]|uniref:hypothetical protein n=1 Tax=Streptomyces sp. NPDC088789 TaxID=3365899 RepID=UPI00380A67E0